MIVDYENPLKKMMEEFVPHGKVRRVLCSLSVLDRRYEHSNKWIHFWFLSRPEQDSKSTFILFSFLLILCSLEMTKFSI